MLLAASAVDVAMAVWTAGVVSEDMRELLAGLAHAVGVERPQPAAEVGGDGLESSPNPAQQLAP